MNKTINKQLIPVLSGLLVLQLLIAAGFNLGDSGSNPVTDDQPLAVIDPGAVDSIRIEDGKDSVELARLDDHWQVSSLDFPADSERVSKLLNDLSSLEKGWPVATTEEAAERFKVTEDSFERRIVLSQGDKALAELYIGTSPGFRQVHARLAGNDDIHSVEFNSYDANTGTGDWIDRAILQRDLADITRAELPTATLFRQDDAFVVEGLNEAQETNAEEAESLLKKVAELKIQSVLGKSLDNPGKAVDTIKLKLKDEQEVSYEISKPEDEHYYVLKSSDQPFYFKVPTFVLNPILDMEWEKLVQAKQSGTPKEDTTAVANAPESDSKS